MTTRFWFHVLVSSALAVGLCVFFCFWQKGTAAPRPESFAEQVGVLALNLAFLFILALLLLRTTGSDRTMGLLGLYAVVIYVPFISFAMASLGNAAALSLFAAALFESLDTDLGRASATRSGFFAAAACVIEPSFLAPAAALLPVVLLIGRRRPLVPIRFIAAFAILWFALTRLLDFGAEEGGVFPLRQDAALREPRWWLGVLADRARDLRSALEAGFLSPYAAFAFAGLIVATVRRKGPSRRAVTVAAWLLFVAALASVLLDEDAAATVVPLLFLLTVVLANTGLAALAAMNPLHAGRRRMIPASVFFLLPPIVAWARVLL